MVIYYLNIFRSRLLPTEADAPLIVDTNAVLAGSVTSQRLKAIPGWHPQVLQSAGNLQLSQLSTRHHGNIRKPFHANTPGKGFGISAFKRPDHDPILTRHMINVKHEYRGQWKVSKRSNRSDQVLAELVRKKGRCEKKGTLLGS
jgi:hypothetical protein